MHTNIHETAGENLLYDPGNSNLGSVTTQRGGTGWKMGGRLKKEEAYVCLWLIHVDIWQKPEYCNYPSIKNKEKKEDSRKKVKKKMMETSYPIYGYLSKENENTNSKRYLHSHVR